MSNTYHSHLIRGVYLISGLRFYTSEHDFLFAIEQAFQAGIKLFQLRIKDELSDKDHLYLAKQVRKLTKQYKVTFILNDRPDLALLCDADGVHLGPTDMDILEARKMMGNRIIGKSSHNYFEVSVAVQEDINYLSVGPIYKTDSKKKPDPVVGIELLEKAKKISLFPIVAIGGIDLQRLPEVLATGIECFGVIRGIMASKFIQKTTKEYIEASHSLVK